MIINLSLATPSQTSTERRIYERLYNDGNILLVAAAGNGGDDQFSYPASHDSVISVASVTSSKRRSSFSQFNSGVELSAPGSGIYVTGAAVEGIEVSSGTSYACPFVAAIAARVWAAGPRCRNSDIRDAMQNELASELYRETEIDILMKEAEDVAQRREACQDMQDLLTKALEIVNEVRDYNSFNLE